MKKMNLGNCKLTVFPLHLLTYGAGACRKDKCVVAKFVVAVIANVHRTLSGQLLAEFGGDCRQCGQGFRLLLSYFVAVANAVSLKKK